MSKKKRYMYSPLMRHIITSRKLHQLNFKNHSEKIGVHVGKHFDIRIIQFGYIDQGPLITDGRNSNEM